MVLSVQVHFGIARRSQLAEDERKLLALESRLKVIQEELRAQREITQELEAELQYSQAKVKKVKHDMEMREQDIAEKEQNVRILESQLDEREQSLAAREVNIPDTPHAKAESILKLLEEKYTCAL